ETARLGQLNSHAGCVAIENDSRGPGHPAGRHLDLGFLFRAVFRRGDSPFLPKAASIAPSGNKSSEAHEICTTFPAQSAPCPQCPAPRRWTNKCSADHTVSLLLVGGPIGGAHFAMGGCACDFRNCCVALRSNPKAPRAFSALSTLDDRRLPLADLDAAS